MPLSHVCVPVVEGSNTGERARGRAAHAGAALATLCGALAWTYSAEGVPPPLDARSARRTTDPPGALELREREGGSPRPARPTPEPGSAGAPLTGHEAVVALTGPRGLVCSGTLVAPTVVLTARHCLPIREVRFGVDPRAPFAVSSVRGHRTPPIAGVDVALVQLAAPSKVEPMRYRGAQDVAPPVGVVRMVGFGATDPQGERGMGPRHFVDVRARGWGCAATDEARTGCTPGLEMVLPRDGGNDTCSGDSGGPVLEQTEGGLRVVAVTARQLRGSLLACGDGGVYTRADVVGAWITRTIREMGRTR